MQAGYRPSRWLRDKVRALYGDTCQRCGIPQGAGPPIEVAHIVPWPTGATEEANLTLLCKPCNNSDRRGWGDLPRPRGYDLPQTKAEFDAIVNRVLARTLPYPNLAGYVNLER